MLAPRPDPRATGSRHVPGSIQPHGCLLVVEPQSLRLLQASANAAQLLRAPGLAAGRDWPRPHPAADGLLQWLQARQGADATAGASPPTHTLSTPQQQLHARLHHGPQGLLVELEAAPPGEAGQPGALHPLDRAFADRIQGAADVRALCQVAAEEVRRLTGFHRVMVCRFGPEWHGTVIAEDGDGTLPSCLDLHLPASDLPAQERALYLHSRLCMVPDADYRPVPMEPAASPMDGQALDLSCVGLCSVPPLHLQYMRDMGTAASVSVSLVVGGALWGLVSCHHATPRVLAPPWRATCEFLGQLLSLQIEARERSAHASACQALKDVETALLARMLRTPSLQAGLAGQPQAWLQLAGASGAAIVQDGAVLTAGCTPQPGQINALAAWLRREHGGLGVYATHELPSRYAPAAAFAESACGLLAVPVSALHAHYILWFRPELVHTVRWAGRPAEAQDAQAQRHPRGALAHRVEEVRGQAEPWSTAHAEAAASLRNAVTAFVLKSAEERAQATEKLQSTNRELEAFAYSISHDLRAPFRQVAGYAQLLREQGGFDERARHYVDSILASATSAGQLVDDLLNFSQLGRAALEPTRVDTNKMVAELRRSLEMEGAGRSLRWDVALLPPAWADAAMLRQAMGNLLDNALKYTRGRDPAVITVTGEERPHETVYAVRDNGVGFDMAYGGKLFGVFQRLHRAEDFEGTGIGLALVRRIVDRHGGWVAAEGHLEHGALFRIGLPRGPASSRAGEKESA